MKIFKYDIFCINGTNKIPVNKKLKKETQWDLLNCEIFNSFVKSNSWGLYLIRNPILELILENVFHQFFNIVLSIFIQRIVRNTICTLNSTKPWKEITPDRNDT